MTALEEMGCSLAQGFLLAKPDTTDAVERLLASEDSRRAVASPSF